jgi:tight adherence protein B
MDPLLVNILAFTAVFLIVFGANAVLLDLRSSERRQLKKRMGERFRPQDAWRARTAAAAQDFSKLAAEAAEESKSDRTLSESIAHMIEQSGLSVTASRLATYSVLSAVLLGAAGGLTLQSVAFGLVALAIGAVLPFGYVHFKRLERLEKLRGQLPDAFDLMSRVLRAGQTVSQAMQCVADEFTRPIALEFLYCSEQMNLGMPADAALKELGRRTGILEIKIFVLAVTVHRQTGGNLAELLDKLAHVVRERARIRGMIRSLTAQGRFQAGILLSLPPAMFLLLMVVDREYEMILLQYPMMIAAALGLMALGALWVRSIVNFEF